MLLNQYTDPDKSQWKRLTSRPTLLREDLTTTVSKIMADVAEGGDQSLREFTVKFDRVRLSELKLPNSAFDVARRDLPQNLREAIDLAHRNITSFHQTQLLQKELIETMPGVKCWREARPINPVGLYIPGGTAPLFSTVLMLGVPAHIAGCRDVILCTPPDENGRIASEIIYAAECCGIQQIFMVGGAQAIAAMAIGTETINQVAKIFGPGNQFVTEAKMQAQKFGVAIDMPAGPSEVLVIADTSAKPEFLASDLLSQAEHGSDSQVILLSTSQKVIDETELELQRQLELLPRKEMARNALSNGAAIYFPDLETCISFSNRYAPEHLILSLNNPSSWIEKIEAAGSVFLGHYSPEAAGDYASGTNHTLPTNGWARSYSGVSVDSFVKKITFQSLSTSGLENVADAVELMATAESLIAHKNAISIRRKKKLGS